MKRLICELRQKHQLGEGRMLAPAAPRETRSRKREEATPGPRRRWRAGSAGRAHAGERPRGEESLPRPRRHRNFSRNRVRPAFFLRKIPLSDTTHTRLPTPTPRRPPSRPGPGRPRSAARAQAHAPQAAARPAPARSSAYLSAPPRSPQCLSAPVHRPRRAALRSPALSVPASRRLPHRAPAGPGAPGRAKVSK